ncbi:MAG TPA: M1 family metallopeptidase [Pyrinomonadaceae bacterium]
MANSPVNPYSLLAPRFPRKQQIVFLTLLLLLLPLDVSAFRRERVVDSWRPLHYAVNIKLSDNLTEIADARTEIKAHALKTVTLIDLDFGDMAIDSVMVDYQVVKFDHRAGILRLKLPEAKPRDSRFTILVVYHGKPRDGLILTADKDGKPSAIGDNWPDRVHNWIPCLDHPSAKATVNFTVTVPEQNIVVANGALDRVETIGKGLRTWSFSEKVPIPPYCMIIAVGQFATLDGGKPGSIPLTFYVPSSDRKYAPKGFSPAGPALKFFSQTVAPYPYEKLALIVGATRFGGMENSSAIVFASTLFAPNPSARLSRTFGTRIGIVDVVSHEIAHQWFGDSVTESTWADLWLSEGFATYFAALFIQRFDGDQAFQDYMKQAAETYFRYEQHSKTPIFDRDTEDLMKLLNPNNYQKGAWVLHMLRVILGDDAFFRGIRDYYDSHKSGNASSEDLRAALEKSSGQNLKDFFASWVYGTGHPHYEVTWKWKKGELVVTLRQLQPEAVFSNPVPIEVTTATGKQRFTLSPRTRETVERFPLSVDPVGVDIDPNNTVLKEISLKTQRQVN